MVNNYESVCAPATSHLFTNNSNPQMRTSSIRILTGLAVVPLLLAMVWMLPYPGSPGRPAQPAWPQWIALNLALAYGTFFLMAAIAAGMLRLLRWRAVWQYGLVMFVVAFANYAGAFWYASSYGGTGEGGMKGTAASTLDGSAWLVAGLQAAQSAAWLAIAFVLFWAIAVRSRD